MAVQQDAPVRPRGAPEQGPNAFSQRLDFIAKTTSISGVILIIASAVCFVCTVVGLLIRFNNFQSFFDRYSNISLVYDDSTHVKMWDYYGSSLIVYLILLSLGFLLLVVGCALVLSSKSTVRQIIPIGDRRIYTDILNSPNSEAGIDGYVRLSSLTGITGKFQQLGFTGLPLATLAITVFFALLSINVATSQPNISALLLDFSKLTLGAFIGSFVQRQQEEKGVPAREAALSVHTAAAPAREQGQTSPRK